MLMLSYLLSVSWQSHTVVSDHTVSNLSPSTVFYILCVGLCCMRIIINCMLYRYIYTTIGEACVCVCAKFDQFLPVRPHFDTKRPVNFFHIATFPSPTFGPLFAFHCPLFFTKNNNLYYYRRGVCVCVCKFDQFLPVRPHFDTKRPVNFFHIATFPSPTFGPLFAFHCPLFFYEKQ